MTSDDAGDDANAADADDTTDDGGETVDDESDVVAADDGGDVAARYEETGGERRLVLTAGGTTVTVASPLAGYGMLTVRRGGEEVERYYGFAMALDHAAELLGVAPAAIPVPDAAADMGM